MLRNLRRLSSSSPLGEKWLSSSLSSLFDPVVINYNPPLSLFPENFFLQASGKETRIPKYSVNVRTLERPFQVSKVSFDSLEIETWREVYFALTLSEKMKPASPSQVQGLVDRALSSDFDSSESFFLFASLEILAKEIKDISQTPSLSASQQFDSNDVPLVIETISEEEAYKAWTIPDGSPFQTRLSSRRALRPLLASLRPLIGGAFESRLLATLSAFPSRFGDSGDPTAMGAAFAWLGSIEGVSKAGKLFQWFEKSQGFRALNELTGVWLLRRLEGVAAPEAQELAAKIISHPEVKASGYSTAELPTSARQFEDWATGRITSEIWKGFAAMNPGVRRLPEVFSGPAIAEVAAGAAKAGPKAMREFCAGLAPASYCLARAAGSWSVESLPKLETTRGSEAESWPPMSNEKQEGMDWTRQTRVAKNGYSGIWPSMPVEKAGPGPLQFNAAAAAEWRAELLALVRRLSPSYMSPLGASFAWSGRRGTEEVATICGHAAGVAADLLSRVTSAVEVMANYLQGIEEFEEFARKNYSELRELRRLPPPILLQNNWLLLRIKHAVEDLGPIEQLLVLSDFPYLFDPNETQSTLDAGVEALRKGGSQTLKTVAGSGCLRLAFGRPELATCPEMASMIKEAFAAPRDERPPAKLPEFRRNPTPENTNQVLDDLISENRDEYPPTQNLEVTIGSFAPASIAARLIEASEAAAGAGGLEVAEALRLAAKSIDVRELLGDDVLSLIKSDSSWIDRLSQNLSSLFACHYDGQNLSIFRGRALDALGPTGRAAAAKAVQKFLDEPKSANYRQIFGMTLLSIALSNEGGLRPAEILGLWPGGSDAGFSSLYSFARQGEMNYSHFDWWRRAPLRSFSLEGRCRLLESAGDPKSSLEAIASIAIVCARERLAIEGLLPALLRRLGKPQHCPPLLLAALCGAIPFPQERKEFYEFMAQGLDILLELDSNPQGFNNSSQRPDTSDYCLDTSLYGLDSLLQQVRPSLGFDSPPQGLQCLLGSVFSLAAINSRFANENSALLDRFDTAARVSRPISRNPISGAPFATSFSGRSRWPQQPLKTRGLVFADFSFCNMEVFSAGAPLLSVDAESFAPMGAGLGSAGGRLAIADQIGQGFGVEASQVFSADVSWNEALMQRRAGLGGRLEPISPGIVGGNKVKLLSFWQHFDKIIENGEIVLMPSSAMMFAAEKIVKTNPKFAEKQIEFIVADPDNDKQKEQLEEFKKEAIEFRDALRRDELEGDEEEDTNEF